MGWAIALMILPLIVATTHAGLRALPPDLRRSATALGLSRTTILFRLLLPTAWPSLLVGVLLGLGRALAETAALVFTSGYVSRMPRSLLDSGRTLSVHIYDLSNIASGRDRASLAAFTLMLSLLIINFIVRWIGRSGLKSK